MAPENKPTRTPRKGFLPIDTNTFDRFFISVVILVAVHLIWFRFIEQFASINIATILCLIASFIIIRWG